MPNCNGILIILQKEFRLSQAYQSLGGIWAPGASPFGTFVGRYSSWKRSEPCWSSDEYVQGTLWGFSLMLRRIDIRAGRSLASVNVGNPSPRRRNDVSHLFIYSTNTYWKQRGLWCLPHGLHFQRWEIGREQATHPTKNAECYTVMGSAWARALRPAPNNRPSFKVMPRRRPLSWGWGEEVGQTTS